MEFTLRKPPAEAWEWLLVAASRHVRYLRKRGSFAKASDLINQVPSHRKERTSYMYPSG